MHQQQKTADELRLRSPQSVQWIRMPPAAVRGEAHRHLVESINAYRAVSDTSVPTTICASSGLDMRFRS
jgi:hypothetical protein